MKSVYANEEDEILALEPPSPMRARPYHRIPCCFEMHRILKKKTTRFILFLLAVLGVFEFLSPSTTVLESARASTGKVYDMMGSDKGQPKVGKIHACFGDCNPTYERALKTHVEHSERMGHPMFVLREKILSGLWSKPAYILSVILNELAMPEEERLQWLLWNDADIVIMNPNIPLDVFIPPSPEFDHVNLLVTNDRHGLNNGVFLIRVNDWSVKLLSGIISYHFFRPQVELKYTEQSGMEEMIEDAYWKRSVVHVPQFWFNSYPISAHREKKKDVRIYEYRPGALQIHFASNRDGKRPERMNAYMDKAEKASDATSPYAVPLAESWYPGNITSFWEELSIQRAKDGATNEAGATNFFPVKSEEGGYVKVDALSDKDEKDEKAKEKETLKETTKEAAKEMVKEIKAVVEKPEPEKVEAEAIETEKREVTSETPQITPETIPAGTHVDAKEKL